MSEAHPVVRRAGEEHIDVTAVIASAFHDLPPAVWLVPDAPQREKIFPQYFRIFVEHAMAYGEVFTTIDGSAVSVWFPVAEEPVPPPPDYDARITEICSAHVARFRVFDELMDAHHLHEPHHYLAFLATLPAQQGTGLGSRLLNDHHARLDAAGVPAYLEASSERSRDLYLRRGYRPLGEPYRLPDGPPMFPLWRQPRG